MNKLLTCRIFLLLLFGLATACRPTRNLVYFSDLQANDSYTTAAGTDMELKIQPDDLLSIRVSSLNPESNVLFNRGILQASGTPIATNTSSESTLADGYVVDKNGNIDFPVLGKVKLVGLTKEEATEQMTKAVQQFVKSPIITVRLLNFKVTVIGEVNRPATFTIPTERINVLEALGLAGDMTAYGRRENVLLVRQKDGVRSTTRLNLNSKALLNSPYFYLQQNDVLYVEPDRIKEVQASTNQRSLTITTMVISILVALAFNFQNIFK